MRLLACHCTHLLHSATSNHCIPVCVCVCVCVCVFVGGVYSMYVRCWIKHDDSAIRFTMFFVPSFLIIIVNCEIVLFSSGFFNYGQPHSSFVSPSFCINSHQQKWLEPVSDIFSDWQPSLLCVWWLYLYLISCYARQEGWTSSSCCSGGCSYSTHSKKHAFLCAHFNFKVELGGWHVLVMSYSTVAGLHLS